MGQAMIKNPELHQQLTEQINTDWSDSEDARDFGSRDLVFARRTQWDDELDLNVDTEYRGQFDIVKPERRRILSELMRNEFSNRFRAKDSEQEKLADILQGHYRAITRTNSAKMAAEVAITEAIDCGFGAWRLEVVDEDETDPLNTNKKIVRTIIHEANNKVVWDSNAKMIDKADAKHCTVVTSYSNSAWKRLMKDYGLTENEAEFSLPEYIRGSSICWVDAQTKTLAECYEIKENKKKYTILTDGVDTIALTNSELRKDGDMYKSMDYRKVNTKRVVERSVWKTVLTGAHILSRKRIAGKRIPIVPLYGEWSFSGGAEIYEGLVRMLRDPQQLRNTTMSYVFDLLAKGPIEKDIYAQEQIDGYEFMYEEQNKYKSPYYLQNLYGEDGRELPIGPLGKKGGPQVPQAAAFLVAESKQAVSDSVGGGMTPEQMINPQVTEDQLQFIKARLDQQAQLYQEHLEYSYRIEGEIVASMFSEVYDTERDIQIISADGQESTQTINKPVQDFESMTIVIENDMQNAEMEVFTDVGLSFSTQKEKVRTEMRELMAMPDIDPQTRQMAQWTYALNLEGSEYKPMREEARKQLVINGHVDEADLTEQEKQMLFDMQQQAQQQGQQPDAMMIAAMAEDKKAQAQLMGEQTDAKKADIEMFNAETKRMELMYRMQKEGIELQGKFAETEAKVRNTNADTAVKMNSIQSTQFNDRVNASKAIADISNRGMNEGAV